MEEYTVGPEDDYDVLIQDDIVPEIVPAEPCDPNPPSVLTARHATWLFSVVGVLGLLDSVFLVLLLLKSKGLTHAGNIYFLHLLLSSVGSWLPFFFWTHPISRDTPLDSVTCQAVTGCHAVAVCAKVFFLLLLILQRYQAVSPVPCLAPGLHTITGKAITSVLAWGLAILVYLPEFAFSKPPRESHAWRCSWSHTPFVPATEAWKYFLTFKATFVTLAIPLTVCLFCGVRMRNTSVFGSRQDDLSRLVFLLLLTFLLMWAPYNVALLLSAAQRPSAGWQGCDHRRKLDASLQVTKIIAIAHGGTGVVLCWILDRVLKSRVCGWIAACGKDTRESPNSSRQPQDRGTRV